ncbi:hypothetical protein [Streptomyces sp. NPDC050263]|uniref:hypothetical protein n=1 Tax=Streptomyces sp. NPDC050263 TaxID=3155037 RepID=UPI00341442B4
MSDHQIIVHCGVLFERAAAVAGRFSVDMTDVTRVVNVTHDTVDGHVLANT